MSVVFCILGCCISVSVPQTCMYNVLKKLTQEYVHITKLAHLLSGALRILARHAFQNYFTPTSSLKFFILAVKNSSNNSMLPFLSSSYLELSIHFQEKNKIVR